MPDNKKQGRSNKTMTFFVCFLAALAGLLFGLDIGVIAGALPFIANEFQISAHTQEWVVSSMMFGAAVGAVGSGWLSFKLGRKKSLMIGAILFVAGSLFSAAAPNVEILLISRVLLGLAVGVASYTAPLYLSEIAPEKIRGSMISMYQLMITIGILGAYLSDTAFSYSGAWRWMLGVIIIPAVLLLIGVIFLPDSPRWFAAKRRFVDAERVLLRLRDTSAEAKRELDEIRESLKVKQSGWALFKENSNFRRAVFLGVLLQIMQQFTGMNVIMYYAPKIFELAGYANTTEQMWGTVIVGLTNVLATFIAIGLVDRWGRKPTLILGFIVMAAGMGVLGSMMHIGIHTDATDVYRRLRDERRPADLGTVFGNPAAERPRFRYHLLYRNQLDCQYDRRRHLPDHAELSRQRQHLLGLRRSERAVYPADYLADSGNQKRLAGTY